MSSNPVGWAPPTSDWDSIVDSWWAVPTLLTSLLLNHGGWHAQSEAMGVVNAAKTLNTKARFDTSQLEDHALRVLRDVPHSTSS